MATEEEPHGKGGRRNLPRVFTDHGVLMAANVLRSEKAVTVTVEIVRAFVRIRAAILTAPDLAKKIAAIEEKLAGFQDQLDVFQGIVLPLLAVHQAGKRKIGFDPKR